MSLRDHIAELRSRLLKALLFVALGAVVGWIFYPQIIDFLKQPYCALPTDRRFEGNGGGECKLIFTSPLDGFMLRLKIGAISGIILAAPFWLYQLWAFITPGLHRRERRYTVVFVLFSSVLFVAGAFLAYLTVENALALLVNLAGDSTLAVLDIVKYMGFVTSMLLVFGVAFELPLLVVMLNLVGVLSAARLRRWQRLSVFGIFVFAAVATPSQDPVSMLMLAIPMALLFEVSVLIASIHDRRKARREAAESFAELPDDVASPLDLGIDPVDGPTPVDGLTPVDGPTPVDDPTPVNDARR